MSSFIFCLRTNWGFVESYWFSPWCAFAFSNNQMARKVDVFIYAVHVKRNLFFVFMLLLVAVSMYSLSFMWSYLHKQCEWISKTFIGKRNAVFLLFYTLSHSHWFTHTLSHSHWLFLMHRTFWTTWITLAHVIWKMMTSCLMWICQRTWLYSMVSMHIHSV